MPDVPAIQKRHQLDLEQVSSHIDFYFTILQISILVGERTCGIYSDAV